MLGDVDIQVNLSGEFEGGIVLDFGSLTDAVNQLVSAEGGSPAPATLNAATDPAPVEPAPIDPIVVDPNAVDLTAVDPNTLTTSPDAGVDPLAPPVDDGFVATPDANLGGSLDGGQDAPVGHDLSADASALRHLILGDFHVSSFGADWAIA